jgi:photosystem II stability/assembly factor-like uncharacterized protein
MKRLGVLFLLAAALAAAAERWHRQYFYDNADGAEFSISGLAFPAAEQGMAVGGLATGRKMKPYAVTTFDGGVTWSPLQVPEPAISLFFVNTHTGWLVARKNIWRTSDFGQKWTKLKGARGALRVFFLDERHGWAVGLNKSVYETGDGGNSWSKVAAASEPATTPERTAYTVIAFASREAGIITGWSRPPEHRRVPDWVDPQWAPREQPAITIQLQTKDGGAHWKVAETSMFGQVTALSVTPSGQGLTLVEFLDSFEYPSEVFRTDWRTGKVDRVFRRKDRSVTDVLVSDKGPAFLAAIEPPGTLFHSPVPGKLKMLESNDLQNWTEMEVDYRAVARRAMLASAGPGNVWVATDTGMILKLTAE